VHLLISQSLILSKFVVKPDFNFVEDILFIDHHGELEGLALLKIDELVLPLRVLSDCSLGIVSISFVVNSETIFFRVLAFFRTMFDDAHSEAGISPEELAGVRFVCFHHSTSTQS
jgi:hypothetical protein